jgi:hypothetical protein
MRQGYLLLRDGTNKLRWCRTILRITHKTVCLTYGQLAGAQIQVQRGALESKQEGTAVLCL